MDILTKLGVDVTFYYQLIVFFFAYLFLNQFLFKPYFKLYNRRTKGLSGQAKDSVEINDEATRLFADYEEKLREVNASIQGFYESAQKEASAFEKERMDLAKSNAEETISRSREEIKKELASAKAQLESLIPEVAHEIENKLLAEN